MTSAQVTRCAACVVVLAWHAVPAIGATCESLTSVSVPHTTVTSARAVEAGKYVPPPPPPGAPPAPPATAFAGLPAFCNVTATSKPSNDSDIKIEVWLPDPATWNGRLRGTAAFGLGGIGILSGSLAGGLRGGYATATNDTGHQGDSRYAIDHPEKIKDWGYRAGHETSVFAKAVIKAYYGKDPAYSVIAEGGGGSVTGSSATQRYPEDYDLVGVNGFSGYWTRLPYGQMWYWQATHATPASQISEAKYAVLKQGALKACDALDGLKDGIIGDVEHCMFDPAEVQCRTVDAPDCLTVPQVEAARKIYQGASDPKTKQQIYGPMYPGSEPGWGRLAGGDVPWRIPLEFFKFFVFKDENWDAKTRPINFETDVALADRSEIQPINAIDPDLKKFFMRGGKMLMVDGWADTDVPPKVAIDYYHNVVAKTGEKLTKEGLRFFMVPGQAHVPGTTGPENFNFDSLSILEEWKKTGKAPDTLIVTHLKNGMEVGKRLVCQYPQIAMYKGSGNTEDPASYMCK